MPASAEGIAFIGPSAEQMRAFGLKHTARDLAATYGVPLLPGSGLLDGIEQARTEAGRIGYPVMLKSTGGGGGIGMRLIEGGNELAEAYASVERLARANFKDGGSTWRSTSSRRATSRCRSSGMAAATSSRSASATAPCSAATRR